MSECTFLKLCVHGHLLATTSPRPSSTTYDHARFNPGATRSASVNLHGVALCVQVPEFPAGTGFPWRTTRALPRATGSGGTKQHRGTSSTTSWTCGGPNRKVARRACVWGASGAAGRAVWMASSARYQSGRRQPGERNCTRNFVLCFCLVFFPGVREWGDRASSRGLPRALRHEVTNPYHFHDAGRLFVLEMLLNAFAIATNLV